MTTPLFMIKIVLAVFGIFQKKKAITPIIYKVSPINFNGMHATLFVLTVNIPKAKQWQRPWLLYMVYICDSFTADSAYRIPFSTSVYHSNLPPVVPGHSSHSTRPDAARSLGVVRTFSSQQEPIATVASAIEYSQILNQVTVPPQSLGFNFVYDAFFYSHHFLSFLTWSSLDIKQLRRQKSISTASSLWDSLLLISHVFAL